MLSGDQDLCARDYERDTAWYPTVKDILPEYYPDKRKVSISVYAWRINRHSYWKSIFPMNRHVRLSVCQLVGWSVGRSVSQSITQTS